MLFRMTDTVHYVKNFGPDWVTAFEVSTDNLCGVVVTTIRSETGEPIGIRQDLETGFVFVQYLNGTAIAAFSLLNFIGARPVEFTPDECKECGGADTKHYLSCSIWPHNQDK